MEKYGEMEEESEEEEEGSVEDEENWLLKLDWQFYDIIWRKRPQGIILF